MQRRIPEPLLSFFIAPLLYTMVTAPALGHPAKSFSDSLDVRPAFFQTRRIVGKVTDELQRPVANAAVLIAGSERGTLTNVSGGFEIADAPLSGTLVVKHPDFDTKQIPIVNSGSEYSISLKPRPRTAGVRSKSQGRALKKDSEANQANESTSMRVDRWPYFPGGYKGLNRFLANNLHYPKEALENGVQGAVQVSFLLDEDGNVSSGLIIKSPGVELEEEALRLTRIMPRWTPAQKEGKPIPVWYTISIHFDPEVDKLPLKIKEEVPKVFSGRMKPEPVKAPLPIKDELRKLFDPSINLSAHKPPQTKLYIYGAGVTSRTMHVPLQPNFKTAP